MSSLLKSFFSMSRQGSGMQSSNPLPATRTYSKFVRFPSSVGIVPVSLFQAISIQVRTVSCPSAFGMSPVSSLWASPRWLSIARLPISVGMPPVRLLYPRSSQVNAVRFPISEGMLPVSWLYQRYRVSSDASWPISAGIVPERLFSGSQSWMTLPSWSVVMPCHSPSGRSESQPWLFVQLSPSVAA